nr:MAG TPA: hypothetical protein [Caudoviricetes sp.]
MRQTYKIFFFYFYLLSYFNPKNKHKKTTAETKL